MLQRLLLLPLLTPLLAVMVVGALNPRPWVGVQLLVWHSPGLPMGAWLSAAAAGGALLSGGATALALRGAPLALRRQVRRSSGPQTRREPEPAWSPPAPAEPEPGGGWAGPSRGPHEPPPTVSVPFRVIRSVASGHGSTTAPPAGRDPAPMGRGEDGWDTAADEDW